MGNQRSPSRTPPLHHPGVKAWLSALFILGVATMFAPFFGLILAPLLIVGFVVVALGSRNSRNA
jgi:hypothetical protein